MKKSPILNAVMLCCGGMGVVSGAGAEPASKPVIANVRDYGAVGDGETMDTQAIQDAIDACNKNKGGTVWVPKGDYHIKTIVLKSNVTLSLDYGATLLGSQDIKDYRTDLRKAREGWVHTLIYAEDATNIKIEGLGVIDGRGTPEAFPKWGPNRERPPRPRLLRMENCSNVTFSGVTYKRPAFWGLHLIDCKKLHFSAVTIRFRNNAENNDGIDLDGCEDVLIENCDINSGDDAICLKSSLNPCRKIVVRGCKVSSGTSPLKFGSSSRGGFINVKVTNCYFYDSPMGAIKLQLVDGGRLEDVDISRITMEKVGNPIFIRLGDRGNSYQGGRKRRRAPAGTLKNVRIRDLTAKVVGEEKRKTGPIMITGVPGHNVEDVLLENITISYPGGGTDADAKETVAEDVDRYPEQFFFGTLPAWGTYIRHARNIRFKNVKLSARKPDKRKKAILDDVEEFVDE